MSKLKAMPTGHIQDSIHIAPGREHQQWKARRNLLNADFRSVMTTQHEGIRVGNSARENPGIHVGGILKRRRHL